MPRPPRNRPFCQRVRAIHTALMLVLGLGLTAALMGAASGDDTHPGNPLSLPACKHALGTHEPSLALVAPRPEAEETCTNAPESSDKPDPSGEATHKATHEPEPSGGHETTGPATPTPSATATPRGRKYRLIGEWVLPKASDQVDIVVWIAGEKLPRLFKGRYGESFDKEFTTLGRGLTFNIRPHEIRRIPPYMSCEILLLATGQRIIRNNQPDEKDGVLCPAPG